MCIRSHFILVLRVKLVRENSCAFIEALGARLVFTSAAKNEGMNILREHLDKVKTRRAIIEMHLIVLFYNYNC